MQSVPITTDIVSSNLDQAKCTTLCDKVYQWLATGRWLSQGTLVSSTNTIDRHDIANPNNPVVILRSRWSLH